jgi:hypothetical protein
MVSQGTLTIPGLTEDMKNAVRFDQEIPLSPSMTQGTPGIPRALPEGIPGAGKPVPALPASRTSGNIDPLR